MKGIFFATSILSIALVSTGSAQGSIPSAEDGDHYTRAQLKQLTREAHTPEQYRTLAGYYEKQHKDYLQQAVEEKQEWVRRSQNIMGVAAKYPRPVDLLGISTNTMLKKPPRQAYSRQNILNWRSRQRQRQNSNAYSASEVEEKEGGLI